MTDEAMMPIEADQTTWTLSAHRTAVRLTLPPLPLGGLPESLKIHIEFDATTIDAMLERLTILRSQMLPPITSN